MNFPEFGGERQDSVAYGAYSVFGVFRGDADGLPIVTANTRPKAIAAYIKHVSEREEEAHVGESLALEMIEHGDVFVRRCLIAYAFHNLSEEAEPSPEWIAGESAHMAVAAERVRCAAIMESTIAQLYDLGYHTAAMAPLHDALERIRGRENGETPR